MKLTKMNIWQVNPSAILKNAFRFAGRQVVQGLLDQVGSGIIGTMYVPFGRQDPQKSNFRWKANYVGDSLKLTLQSRNSFGLFRNVERKISARCAVKPDDHYNTKPIVGFDPLATFDKVSFENNKWKITPAKDKAADTVIVPGFIVKRVRHERFSEEADKIKFEQKYLRNMLPSEKLKKQLDAKFRMIGAGRETHDGAPRPAKANIVAGPSLQS